MPEEWASMRSIARWVLPVLVGPSTAVTPAPRARTSRFGGAENETGISDRLESRWRPNARPATWLHRPAQSGLGKTRRKPRLKQGNSAVPARRDLGLILSAAQLGPPLEFPTADIPRFCTILQRRRDATLTNG